MLMPRLTESLARLIFKSLQMIKKRNKSIQEFITPEAKAI